MVFVFSEWPANRRGQGITAVKFRFLSVLGAMLTEAHWQFAGRSETSRRTITASVLPCGYDKMAANWIYRAPGLSREAEADLIALNPDE